jgi:hypothetical protein
VNAEAHKQFILTWCLQMAQVDPEYAVWAAGWYESNQPHLLKNLKAKVEQEVRRNATSRVDAPRP